MEQFRNVGLIGRPGSTSVSDTLEYLQRFLEGRGIKVIFDEGTAAMLPHRSDLQVGTRTMLGEACDLIIVVGGDGSLLHAARSLARFNKPLLGINRGRLGFLTDVSPSEIDAKIDAVLAGDYSIEQRFLLNMEVKSAGSPVGEGIALNDVVLYAGKSVHMIEFELYIEGQFVYRQRSDGLIIATPTGSTAYALSGGGPIMHPRIDAMVLVPMHPHTLSSRPIVVDGNSEIKLLMCPQDISPMVSCDGQSGVTLRSGDWVYVNKHPFKLRLLHPPGHDFYEACRTKLGWSSHLPAQGES
ncbi:MAG: ppnK [Moraxellaceae bacterium]|jgi:NAD+ kinase|nr:ppnK [Moraxellaceae bacterium]MDF3029560.1 ppnK [Moraxellaceae bacterium]